MFTFFVFLLILQHGFLFSERKEESIRLNLSEKKKTKVLELDKKGMSYRKTAETFQV